MASGSITSPEAPDISPYDEDNSDSSFIDDSETRTNNTTQYTSYTIEDHLTTLHSLQQHDLTNEAGINALPRRRNKSQRPLAMQLAQTLYPNLTEIFAIIRYEYLTDFAKAVVRHKEKERALAAMGPRSNAGGRLLHIQGPWAGQEIDPVDLKGPGAIPMPVKIGTTEDFAPIFDFLGQNRPIEDGEGKHHFEILWKTPIVEFNRGIVYEDGRLDLCKQVVGPTHIGKLMESLELNQYVRHFLLGNNAISTTGAKQIAQFIRKYPNHMETWYLAGCHITRHGLSLLATEMVNSTSINNLWFKRNPFGPDSALLLAELVTQIPTLRTLDLETTELGDVGTGRFIDAITGKASALRHLYLNANGIGENACTSLGRYLADPHCTLESLFLSTNPIGDAGITLLVPGITKNKTLKRLTLASTGLTSKGVSALATAIVDGDLPLHTLDFGASMTTKAHDQRFNHLADACIPALKSLMLLPSLQSLNLGRSVFSVKGIQEIRTIATHSKLVHLEVHRVEITDVKVPASGNTEIHEGMVPPKSCSLEIRNHLTRNQAKYYPHIKNYDDFLNSEELRFLKNTSDVRQIDSHYRTRDKRLGVVQEQTWEEGDPTWKLIIEDAEKAMADLEVV